MPSVFHSLFRAVVNVPAAVHSAVVGSDSGASSPNRSVEGPHHSNSNAPHSTACAHATPNSTHHSVAHSSGSLSASACPVAHHQKDFSSLSADEIAAHHQRMHAQINYQNPNANAPPAAVTGGNPLAGGCPVPHHLRHPSPAPTSASLPLSTTALSASTAESSAVNSSHSDDVREPPDSADHIIGGSHSSSSYLSPRQDSDLLVDSKDSEGEKIPDSLIPASGRGNSDDGANWVNPSANQLYRALKRKNKPIEKEDALSVAAIHEWVTNGTWAEIVKVESELYPKCPPKLIRFQGQDGNYSWKAWWLSKVLGKSSLPFDRHDWYIQRCDKEVKYIIDYYSYEIKAPGEKNNDTYTVYTIDARPAPTPRGTIDRARIAWRRWRSGEEWW